jgi:uncharacterized protein YoxC
MEVSSYWTISSIILITLYSIFIVVLTFYISGRVKEIFKLLNNFENVIKNLENGLNNIDKSSYQINNNQKKIKQDLNVIDIVLKKYKGISFDTQVNTSLMSEIEERLKIEESKKLPQYKKVEDTRIIEEKEEETPCIFIDKPRNKKILSQSPIKSKFVGAVDRVVHTVDNLTDKIRNVDNLEYKVNDSFSTTKIPNVNPLQNIYKYEDNFSLEDSMEENKKVEVQQ